MKFHLFKTLLLFLALSQNSLSFSQNSVRGTYHLVNNPSDAAGSPGPEFPIYLYEASIKLKWFNKMKYTIIQTDSISVWKGKWSLSVKTIKLDFQANGNLETRTFELVKLKSGSYIKPVNDYFHYHEKKE